MLATIGLPFEAKDHEKVSSNKGLGLQITASDNMIIFYQEVRSGK